MTEIPDEIMAKAIKRLQKQLKDFDAEATWELANGGERADLWTEIDVSVDDVRFVIDDYTNLIRQNAELRAEIAALLSERTASEAALKEAREVAEGWKPTHRHVKTGGEYMLIGIGKVQAANWFEDGPTTMGPVDLREVAIYRDRDGRHWVRPIEEFDDGRFASLASSPATGGA